MVKQKMVGLVTVVCFAVTLNPCELRAQTQNLAIETDIPSLYQTFADYFTIGAAVWPGDIVGVHSELLKKHFNSITAENAMKWDTIEPTEGNFNFAPADALVAFAKANHIRVRGHTLCWHKQVPAWVFQDAAGHDMTPTPENKALLLRRLENHIRGVVAHYKDDVYAWDVVNEVIDPKQPDGFRRSPWFRITGIDFIETAFRVAHEVAPQAELFINEYDTTKVPKRTFYYDLVRDLRKRGVPIDGVGHQMHSDIRKPAAAEIVKTINLFSALGVDNQITELDLSVYSDRTSRYEAISEGLLEQQARRYGELFAAFRQLKGKISSVTFWGQADDHTWLKSYFIRRLDLPLLFDEHLQPKPAYWAVVGPSHLKHGPAETGAEAWLRYARLPQAERVLYDSLPVSLAVLGDSPLLHSAQQEMVRGIQGLLGRTLRESGAQIREQSIVLGTLANIQALSPGFKTPTDLRPDGFWLTTARIRDFDCTIITGTTERGVLYGAFAFLSRIARDENAATLDLWEQPYAPIRWIDQWDNLDGSIERGYAGPSIFFENGSVRADLTRAGEYARLLASLGINGCTINNVNANPTVLDDNFLPQLARVADVFRPWGVQLAISVNLASPKLLGALNTFDPLGPQVEEWWKKKIDEIYRLIPDFAGVVVKADSEGQLGPSTYGRTPADAANLIARALAPHHGLVFYRAFVYNHHLDWTNPKNDRAKAAYDNFHPLDGKFDDNVIIQIKNGPIDFQVREPVSPLFSGLRHTNVAIELQITQEYLGQQRHLCFLPPMWKEALDFDMRIDGNRTPVKEIVAGTMFHRHLGGFVGVANVGTDTNWLGHPLAMANLYSFGRLAWDPNLSAATLVDEWTRLTFGNDPLVVKTISDMQLTSCQTYENYTGPLGIGTLTDIQGSHYGPGVESSERNGWGQWHRADHDGVGMDRSVATGTGYTAQYQPPVAAMYESVATTPDELLLFFHHVPYTHVLHSGKTVIQYIYDSHYEGAERARQYIPQWKLLHGHIDDARYAAVLARLEYQAGHAIVWRDAVCNWFLRTSGIPDAGGRVGHYPDRIEAETMQLRGYQPIDVLPAEDASGGKAVACTLSHQSCSASFAFKGPAARYDMNVQYFDQITGVSKFRVFVGDRLMDEWSADDHLPAKTVGGDSSTRRHIPGISLRPGDEVRIEGTPDGEEHAALDYAEILPAAPNEDLELALTFDDLPAHGPLPPGLTRVDIIRSIIASLRAAQAPQPYGFINAIQLQDDPNHKQVLQLWRDAGFLLGNHTFSHMDLNANSLDAFEQNVLANEATLRSYMGSADWRWLRFPYLREGDTQEKHRGVAAFLQQHGYKVAEVTLDFSDYAYNEPYARCLADNNSQAIDWLKQSYLERAEESLVAEEKMSDLVYERQIRHVMLLHVGGFETVMLPSLLDLLKRHGFKLVTLQEAESDPAYAGNPDGFSPGGATFLQRMMQSRHIAPMALSENIFDKLSALCRN